LSSTNPAFDPVGLGDFAARSVLPELQRVPGVGQANLFGTERAMRIWLDPVRLQALRLSTADVNAAIAQQNLQVTSGTLGEQPAVTDQAVTSTVVVQGRLNTIEEFGNIVLRANADGSSVRLKDVARIELGAQGYGFRTRLNGEPSAGMSVQLASGANALETADLIREKIAQIEKFFPPGVKATIPFDGSTFVRISIQQVAKTLIEAVILVFLVMFLFLQNIRYTIIPTLVVPVALLGTFAALLAMGFSINVLTMFGMVLVIGIVVDDAIVVVENVERIMSEEGLSPRAATQKALSQISGAIVGVTVVLVSVFIPLAFFSGAIGNIYRQFAAVMVTAILLSAFLALSFSPALCATLLKPVQPGHHHAKKGFFGWFNRSYARAARGYEGIVARMVRQTGRYLVIYAAVIGAAGVMYTRLPTAFVPNEDQGNILINVLLPPGATQQRTLEVMKQIEGVMLKQPEVAAMTSVMGFNFSGSGQNSALNFVALKDWDERPDPEQSAQALVKRAQGMLSGIRDAFIFPVSPPAIRELGRANGFAFRLQDRAGVGRDVLLQARNQLLGEAQKSPLLAAVRPDGLEDAAQVELEINRDRAAALGVSFGAVNNVLATSLGSAYINDFLNQGRVQRVIVQADAPARMEPDDLLQLTVLNAQGQAVPLGAFAKTKWITGAMQAVRYNGYPAMRIAGEPAKGVSSGEAIAEIERLAAQLPNGIGYEWTGLAREEKLSGATAYLLFFFSMLAVFLCLAALYESWSIPLSVILVVPLGVLGVVSATLMRGLENDVFFKVGMITIIGLSAKNAVLIIEFAKDLHARGKDVIEAVLEAAHLRLRPIIMTSMAFILGVMPLVLATGAGSAGQRSIGTGVLGGMISATALAIFMVPVFFVVVRRLFKGSERQRQLYAHEDPDKPKAEDWS
jgi:multidrug efflux pump